MKFIFLIGRYCGASDRFGRKCAPDGAPACQRVTDFIQKFDHSCSETMSVVICNHDKSMIKGDQVRFFFYVYTPISGPCQLQLPPPRLLPPPARLHAYSSGRARAAGVGAGACGGGGCSRVGRSRRFVQLRKERLRRRSGVTASAAQH